MNAFLPTSRNSLVRSSGVFGFAVLFGLVIASCGGGGGSSSSTPTTGGGATPPPPTTPTPPTTAVLFFGAQTHFGQGWPATMAARVAAANIRDVRDELFWEIVESNAGAYVFPATYDAYMAALRDQGISPLIALDFENHNYDGGQTPYTDAGIAAYARYAVAVVRHYGTQIKAVEIWNEYNGSFAKGPATADRAATYYRMLKATYQAIKAERPDVTVVGGATAGVPLPYFDRLFSLGALNYLDAVSIHPYRYDSTPEGVEVQVAALQELMARRGGAKPIWVTEIGWSTHAPAAPGDLNIDETVQARFLVRSFALLVSAGVRQMYWYQFRNETGEGNMGLVNNDGGFTAKRSFTAMATLNTQLRNATFVAREQTASNVYSMRFSAGGELRVLWALSPLSVAVPSGTRVTDIFGATVSSGGNTITVADSPVYVSGPLPALAGASTSRAASAITDSAAAFSLQQGSYGWNYGYFVGPGTTFQPLVTTRVTDWKEEWISNFPSLFIAETDQHPSFSGGQPISAVRRWTSTVNGNVRITAHFKIGTQGDGVRVRVLADSQVIYTATLSIGTSIVGDFTADRNVSVGTNLDFAVDPGPANNINYDATLVAVTIERAN